MTNINISTLDITRYKDAIAIVSGKNKCKKTKFFGSDGHKGNIIYEKDGYLKIEGNPTISNCTFYRNIAEICDESIGLDGLFILNEINLFNRIKLGIKLFIKILTKNLNIN